MDIYLAFHHVIIGRRFAPPEKYMVKYISVEMELPVKLNSSLIDQMGLSIKP